MKSVTVSDAVFEVVFGIVLGALFVGFSVAGLCGHPVLNITVYASLCFSLQAMADLVRGRGWRYSFACAGLLAAGFMAGAYGFVYGQVLVWWALAL